MPKNLLDYIALVLVIMLIFVVFNYQLLIDAFVIYDHFFLEGFIYKTNIFAVMGYAVAGLCFVVYLLLADKAHELNKSYIDEQKNVLDRTNPLFEEYKKKLSTLTSTFNYSFGFSALILSTFIVWLGIMFNAVNSMELMRHFRQISGRNFLNENFVYLIGVLHSLLLLIFYIPVQLKFDSLKIVEEKKAALAGMPAPKKIFLGFFSGLSSILLTASPLISSFLQKILSTFFES